MVTVTPFGTGTGSFPMRDSLHSTTKAPRAEAAGAAFMRTASPAKALCALLRASMLLTPARTDGE